MTRPLSIWLAFIACALLGLGALWMVSRHAVGLENDRLLAEVESDQAQRIRLALWRMDSEAAAFLMRENNRPPSDFKKAMRPTNSPAEATIYFEIDQDGLLASVAPSGSMSKERVRRLLGVGDSPPVVPNDVSQTFNSNSGIAYAVANVFNDNSASLPNQAAGDPNDAEQVAQAESKPVPPPMVKEIAPKAEKPVAQDYGKPSPVAQQGGKDSQVLQARARNQEADFNELNQRAKLVQKSTNRIVLPSYQVEAQQDAGPEILPPQQEWAGQGTPSAWLQATSPSEGGVTAFQPVWIDNELLLVRAVGPEARRRVQGIWLDRRAIASSLLAQVKDLLPGASLKPYEPFVFTRDNVTQAESAAGLGETRLKASPRSLDNPPMALLGLPWELVPGAIPSLPSLTGTPLRLLLGLAWGGAALAMFAAAFLLRGVLGLSERRAAFVSAVTHELRTPLTTFTLYSEMLADGMVRDPDKQQEYLRTLQRESGRLGHLVENVLAYSRIERGSARARMEKVDVQSMVDRVLPRVRERASSVGAGIELELSAHLAGCALETDVGVVEQIVFNLVDNAAKYAAPSQGSEPWKLSLHAASKWLHLDFRDSGPGIAAGERRRLFRPFHKSAEDAANSKPGVGLGLALSRRLARALGGELVLLPSNGSGAVFRLALPMRLRET